MSKQAAFLWRQAVAHDYQKLVGQPDYEDPETLAIWMADCRRLEAEYQARIPAAEPITGPQIPEKPEAGQIQGQAHNQTAEGQPEAKQGNPFLAKPGQEPGPGDVIQPDPGNFLDDELEALITEVSNAPLPDPVPGNQTEKQTGAGQGQEQEPEKPSPFAQVDLSVCCGAFYMDNPAPVIHTIFAGLVRGTLGGIVAAPGTGKSTMLAQAVALAGGAPWLDVWEIEQAIRVLVVFGEDPKEIVHTRVRNAIKALPVWAREGARLNFFAIPLRGRVAIVDDMTGRPRPTKAFDDLLALIDQIQPDIIFLDTYSKFIALENENSNSAIRESLELLEEVCEARRITIVLSHHTDKLHSRAGADKAHMNNVLSQVSARGGTGFAASVRWLLTMLPLKADLAGEIIGSHAKNFADGTFVAMKVTKTNYGRQGGVFYFQHMDNGIFQPVEPEKQERRLATVQEDAARLVEIVQGRAKEGLYPLSFSKGIASLDQYADPESGKPWGMSRYHNARQYAVDNGLLEAAKRDKGKGEILAIPDEGASLLSVDQESSGESSGESSD